MNNGVKGGQPENVAVKKVDIVFKADKTPGPAYDGIGKGKPNSQHEGIGKQEEKNGIRWNCKKKSQDTLPLQKAYRLSAFHYSSADIPVAITVILLPAFPFFYKLTIKLFQLFFRCEGRGLRRFSAHADIGKHIHDHILAHRRR